MLFDDLPKSTQRILRDTYNFEPDEVNAMFKTAEEVNALISAGQGARKGKSSTSAPVFKDDGDDDGEIDLKLSREEQAVVNATSTTAKQREFAPSERVSSDDMSEVQRLLASMKEADDDEDLDD